MAPIRVGGVPEHYNAPILKASSSQYVEWTAHPSGTGAMLEALDKNELDLAVMLMEGAVKHAVSTNSVRLIGTYVNDPLPWGVHVSPTGSLKSMDDLDSKISELTFGISRFGSGSHLMAIVHAFAVGSAVPKFKVVNTMTGARDAMVAGEIDVFLWDITTADRYSKEGVWKHIGEVKGDWPAFVFVVRADVLEDMLTRISNFIDAVQTECESMKLNADGSVLQYLRDAYGISEKQAMDFLHKISWNSKLVISRKSLESVVCSLHACGIIPESSVEDSRVVMSKVSRIV